MRVSDGMNYAAMRTSIQTAQSRAMEASNQSSSGKRVAKSSDDPNAYGQAMVYDRTLSRLDAMDRTGNVAQTDMGAATNALDTADNLMTRAKEIAVAGATGTATASDRLAYADEVAQLRASMLAAANTKSGDTYVFSGGKTDTAAFDASGAYQGDSATRSIEIADGSTATVNTPGDQIFKPAGGVDIFDTLAKLEAGLRANDQAAVSAEVDTVDKAKDQVISGRTQLGLTQERVIDSATARDTVRTELAKAKSASVEIDAGASYVSLMQAQAALQGAISTAQRMISSMGNGLYT